MFAGIDLGTSAVKLLITDLQGNGGTYYGEYRENSPEGFWMAVEAAFGRAGARLDLKQVEAVGLSSQSCSYILYDGNSRSPFYGWDYPQGGEMVEKAQGLCTQEEFLRYLSMPCPRMHSYPIPRILWFQDARKEEWKRMRKLLQPKDYICYRLTGAWTSDPYLWRGLANVKRGAFETELLKRLQLPEEQLPSLIDPAGVAGHITPDAASRLGLREGTPVYAGLNDYFASLIGMGITGPGQNYDITGTSEHLGTITEELYISPRLISSPYVNGNVLYGVTSGSGRSLAWSFRTFDIRQELKAEEYLKGNPPIYLPYLEGERAPVWNPNASGTFYGIHSRHTAEDLAYAVYEGVVFSLYHIRSHMNAWGTGALRTSGGASVNRQLNRMKASMLDTPVETVEEKNTSALGAVFCAAVGSGRYGSYKQAAQEQIRILDYVEPERDLHKQLKSRYGIYLELIERLQVLWK